jgi:hypothetical protein
VAQRTAVAASERRARERQKAAVEAEARAQRERQKAERLRGERLAEVLAKVRYRVQRAGLCAAPDQQ